MNFLFKFKKNQTPLVAFMKILSKKNLQIAAAACHHVTRHMSNG